MAGGAWPLRLESLEVKHSSRRLAESENWHSLIIAHFSLTTLRHRHPLARYANRIRFSSYYFSIYYAATGAGKVWLHDKKSFSFSEAMRSSAVAAGVRREKKAISSSTRSEKWKIKKTATTCQQPLSSSLKLQNPCFSSHNIFACSASFASPHESHNARTLVHWTAKIALLCDFNVADSWLTCFGIYCGRNGDAADELSEMLRLPRVMFYRMRQKLFLRGEKKAAAASIKSIINFIISMTAHPEGTSGQ